MKVLVHYTQEFISQGNIKIKISEKITKVFDVSSNLHLLNTYDNYNEIPRHIQKMLGKNALAGQKIMHWYLPKNNEPFIRDDRKRCDVLCVTAKTGKMSTNLE
jgi:hypothetical protein